MYPHLLAQIKQLHPDWKESIVKNTLLMVALILTEKTRSRPAVNLWKLKAGVGKQAGRLWFSLPTLETLALAGKSYPWPLDSNCQSFPEFASWANPVSHY
jgi:hypothetical protein